MTLKEAKALADNIATATQRVDRLQDTLQAARDVEKAAKSDGGRVRCRFYLRNGEYLVPINAGFLVAQVETDLKIAERRLAALTGREITT